MIAAVSLRLPYLIFLQVLGLILMMGRQASSKDVELLVLRHEIAVLDRLLVDLGAGPPPTGPEGKTKRRGSHLPSAAQLRRQRDDPIVHWLLISFYNNLHKRPPYRLLSIRDAQEEYDSSTALNLLGLCE